MSATRDPERFSLTMVAVMIPLVVVISLPLVLLTGWPTWVTSVIGGGAGGLTSPLIARWILARRDSIQDRPSPDTEQ